MDRQYCIQDGLRAYAIGDVHGELRTLLAMEEAIEADLRGYSGEVHIVYLGDYINRGPDSKGVIDHLIAQRDRGDAIERTFLKGNHEAAVFEFMHDPLGSDWLEFGGLETLVSYEIDAEDPLEVARLMKDGVDETHFEFLHELELLKVIGGYCFAHAGIDPYKPLAEQAESDLTCIREPFLSWHLHTDYTPLEKKVVHGHSIYPTPENQPHRVSVDTGCFKDHPLSAVVLEGRDVRFLQVSHKP